MTNFSSSETRYSRLPSSPQPLPLHLDGGGGWAGNLQGGVDDWIS